MRLGRAGWAILPALLLGGCARSIATNPPPSPGSQGPPAGPAEIKPNIDTIPLAEPPLLPATDSALRRPAEAPSPPSPPAPLRHATGPVRLALTGDINLGTFTEPGGIPPDSGRGLFAGVDSLLVGDLVIGNFEGTLADSGFSLKCGPPPDTTVYSSPASRRRHRQVAPQKRKTCYAFGTPSYLASRLAEAGYTHLNLANNHANDFGPANRLVTDSILRGLGIRTYGPLGSIAIDTLHRGDSITVVGVVGFATYPHSYNLLDIERSVAVVDSIRREVDALIVTFHGGTEGAQAIRTARGPESLAGEPRGDLRKWARAVIDAGADAVIGHGPHVLRGIEFYRGRPIFYSLGNFVNYYGFSLAGPQGVTAVLRLELEGDGTFQQARMVPLIQVPRQGPRPDPARRAALLLRRITALDFGKTGATIGKNGEITPPPSIP